jgi:hypothetical protein
MLRQPGGAGLPLLRGQSLSPSRLDDGGHCVELGLVEHKGFFAIAILVEGQARQIGELLGQSYSIDRRRYRISRTETSSEPSPVR